MCVFIYVRQWERWKSVCVQCIILCIVSKIAGVNLLTVVVRNHDEHHKMQLSFMTRESFTSHACTSTSKDTDRRTHVNNKYLSHPALISHHTYTHYIRRSVKHICLLKAGREKLKQKTTSILVRNNQHLLKGRYDDSSPGTCVHLCAQLFAFIVWWKRLEMLICLVANAGLTPPFLLIDFRPNNILIG